MNKPKQVAKQQKPLHNKSSNLTPAELQKMVENKAAEYLQTLLDCQNSPRLTPWEDNFIKSLLKGFENNHLKQRTELSEKQKDVLNRIERKVYDVG